MRLKPVVLAALLAMGAAAPSRERRRGAAPMIPPPLLSRTGLYAPTGSLQIAPANLAYSPQYPLWSDGAAKSRWVFLPRSKNIDVRNPDEWVFPVGTKFWKEFSFHGRKVETRMLWRASAATWIYAAYAWRPDQSDADLVGDSGLKGAAEITPGIAHTIPSIKDCKSCHENTSTVILGFNALQLSTDRDPNALHVEPLLPGMATLRTLVERNLIRPLRREFINDPPRIRAVNSRTRTVLGYLSTNCGNCHQAASPIPNIRLDLRYPCTTSDEAAAPGLLSTLGQRTRSVIPATPSETLAIAPGHPDASLILHRMASRRSISQMPPLGSALVDSEAVAFFRTWIAQDLDPRESHTSPGLPMK